MGRLSTAEKRRAMIEGLSYEDKLTVIVQYMREQFRKCYPVRDVEQICEAGRDRNKARKAEQEIRP